MQTLSKKAAHIRAHTWKDIGGWFGLALDGAFFVFLLFVSGFVLIVGIIALVLNYIFSPVLTLMSVCSKSKNTDESILLEDGTLGTRRLPAAETAKAQPVAATQH